MGKIIILMKWQLFSPSSRKVQMHGRSYERSGHRSYYTCNVVEAHKKMAEPIYLATACILARLQAPVEANSASNSNLYSTFLEFVRAQKTSV